MSYPYYCCDCSLFNPNDQGYRGPGWGYCPKLRRYVEGDSTSCVDIVKKNDSSNCYLTTVVCNVLGYEDDCYILNTLRGFRDNYMKKDEQYDGLLKDYDKVGPKVCKLIEIDKNKTNVATTMLIDYILPSIKHITQNNYDDAITVYKNMTLDIMSYYGVDTSELSFNDEIGPNIVRTRKEETE